MVERSDGEASTGRRVGSRARVPLHRRVGRVALVVAVLAVVTGGGFWSADRLLIGPSHSVSLSNDTGADLDWSCSWSDLRLAAGETGEIRIPEHPHEEFGCVPQPASLRQDMCPSIQLMTAGAVFTATDFAQRFRCRG